eukprot:scaffold69_cov248-Pinguiococcus_pyrenoidosus.AAC.28
MRLTVHSLLGPRRLEWEQLSQTEEVEVEEELEVGETLDTDGQWQKMGIGSSSAMMLPVHFGKYGGMYFNADVASSGAFVIELGAIAALLLLVSGAAAL